MPERTARRARRLQAVAAVVTAGGPLDELVDGLLAAVQDALEADTVSVLLIDGGTHELAPFAARGFRRPLDPGARVRLGTGFAGRVAASTGTIVLADIGAFDLVNPMLYEDGVRSLVGAPLIITSGTVIGVIHAGARTRREFDQAERGLLKLIADRVAVAIEQGLAEDEFQRLRNLRRSFVENATAAVIPAARALAQAAEALRPSLRGESDQVQVVHQRSTDLVRAAVQLIELLASDLDLELCSVDLAAEVRDAIEWAGGSGSRVSLRVARREVVTDPRALQLIVRNLVDNALRHGRPPVTVEAELATGRLHLAVTDHGPGIDGHRARALLAPASQASVPEGGLGLAIVRAYAQALGGGVLYQQEGLKSVFRVAFPIRQR